MELLAAAPACLDQLLGLPMAAVEIMAVEVQAHILLHQAQDQEHTMAEEQTEQFA
jgi:hypothetical protein